MHGRMRATSRACHHPRSPLIESPHTCCFPPPLLHPLSSKRIITKNVQVRRAVFPPLVPVAAVSDVPAGVEGGPETLSVGGHGGSVRPLALLYVGALTLSPPCGQGKNLSSSRYHGPVVRAGISEAFLCCGGLVDCVSWLFYVDCCREVGYISQGRTLRVYHPLKLFAELLAHFLVDTGVSCERVHRDEAIRLAR